MFDWFRARPGLRTTYRSWKLPPKLLRGGRLPGLADLSAFENATPDEQVEVLGYLRYLKAKNTGTSIVTAAAIALSAMAIGMTLLIAQANASAIMAEMAPVLMVPFVVIAFYAIWALVVADRMDERRGWSEAWLTALEPLYSQPVAKSSFFAWRRR